MQRDCLSVTGLMNVLQVTTDDGFVFQVLQRWDHVFSEHCLNSVASRSKSWRLQRPPPDLCRTPNEEWASWPEQPQHWQNDTDNRQYQQSHLVCASNEHRNTQRRNVGYKLFPLLLIFGYCGVTSIFQVGAGIEEWTWNSGRVRMLVGWEVENNIQLPVVFSECSNSSCWYVSVSSSKKRMWAKPKSCSWQVLPRQVMVMQLLPKPRPRKTTKWPTLRPMVQMLNSQQAKNHRPKRKGSKSLKF